MPAVQSTLFNRFPKSDIPTIRISRRTFEEIVAAGPNMDKFHTGTPEFQTGTDFGSLKVVYTALNDEKMVAYVSDGKRVSLLFGRMGPTNFADSRFEVKTPHGVLRIYCTEQLFMLHKACSIENCSNFDESVKAVLLAKAPFGAKRAGRDMKDLVEALWNLKKPAAMFASILFACTNEATFKRYQSFVDACPDPEMAALIAAGAFDVFECNDDGEWGINQFVLAVLRKLAELEPGFDLAEAMAKISEGTANKLGLVLKEFLLAISGQTHEWFMEQIAGLDFFEVIDDEAPAAPMEEEEEESVARDSRTFTEAVSVSSPPTKRQCTADC